MMNIKKFASLLICFFILSNCSTDNTSNSFSLEGKNYVITSWVIENNVDLNNDGIYSNDLVQEKNCFSNIFFNESGVIQNPTSGVLFARVEANQNGNLIQTSSCLIGDGFGMTYELDRNNIAFMIRPSGELFFTGELSNDNREITIVYPNERLLSNFFLYEDGTTEEYGGDVTAVYELVN